MLIVGVDPGTTTGLVKIETAERPLDKRRRRFSVRVIDSAQLPWFDAVRWIDGHLIHADYVAVERFNISQRTITGTRQGPLDAIEMIGVVRALSAINEVPMVMNSASDAKNVFTDANLRAIDVYNQVSGGHARDALRHALLVHRKAT